MAVAVTNRSAILRRLLEASASGDAAILAEVVVDDVVGWSPNMLVTSREQLLDVAAEHDDALSNVVTSIDAVCESVDRAIAEWKLAADHTGPLRVADDLVIEPTGRRLHLAGATIAEFDGDRIVTFRHYFDDLALIEQALDET